MTAGRNNEGRNDSLVTVQAPSINDYDEKPSHKSAESLAINGKSHDNLIDEEEEVGECGLGPCRPRWMRIFRNLTVFCVIYAISGIANFALSMSFATQLTSIEKQFNLTGTSIGLMTTIKDIGLLLPTLFLGYIIRRVHVSRWLATATVLYGVGGLLCIIPYVGTKDQFLLKYTPQLQGVNNTNSSNNSPSKLMCHLDSHSLNHSLPQGQEIASGGLPQVSEHWHMIAKSLFFGTEFMQGVCRSIKGSFLPVFVDDNAEPGTFAKYVGIVFTLELLVSPAMSMGLGAALSKIYVTLEDTDMHFSDPRWVSAWWLGFLVFGTLSIAAAIPLMFFPRRFKVRKDIENVEKKRIEASKGKNKITVEINGFLRQIGKLLSTPLYMMIVVGTSIQGLGRGTGSFELQFKALYFGMDQSLVNLVEGIAGTFMVSIGLMIGSTLSTRYKLSAYNCLRLRIFVSLFLCGVTLLLFLFPCEQPHILAASHHPNPSSYTNMSCSVNCHCDPNTYYPVCGGDGQTYYSPCDAGCTGTSNNQMNFDDCACMGNSTAGTAEGGLCDRHCERNFWIYLGIELFKSLVHPIPAMPFWIVVLRSVDEEQKPMALALWNFVWSILGNIPGPIIFGKLIDTACLVVNGGGGHGACMLYDMPKLRFLFVGFGWVFELVGVGVLSIALIYVRCSKNAEKYMHQEKQDSDEKDNDKEKVKAEKQS